MKILFLLCLSALSISAQSVEKCSLTPDRSPTIRGLRLGMSKADVERLIPPSLGVPLNEWLTYLNRNQLVKLHGFEELKGLDIIFNKQKPDDKFATVSSLTFQYLDSVADWDSVSEFTQSIARSLHLPFSAFEFAGHKAFLRCEGFAVTTMPNYILLKSTALEDQVTKDQVEKKKTFKP